MAQERSDLNNIDRVDPSDNTPSLGGYAASEPDELELEPARDNQIDLAADDENTPAEAGQIMGQIEETRSQMGETIDAIQDKLSFSNISEQVSEHVNNAVETAKEAVYDATIGKAAGIMKNLSNDISKSSIVRTAKDNPFPFILIGLGAGLLAYQGYAGKLGGGHYKRHEFTGPSDRPLDTGPSMADSARDKISGVTDMVSTAAGTAYEKVSGAVDTAYTGAGDAVGRAYDKAGEYGTMAREHYNRHLNENPLAVGAVALALGAAVGFAIPATEYEGQLMGSAREDLMEKAQDTASELLDKTKQVVTEAGRNVLEQARATTEN